MSATLSESRSSRLRRVATGEKALLAVRECLRKDFPRFALTAAIDSRAIVTLSGECDSWQTLVDVGHRIAKVEGVRNVVSDMTVKDLAIPRKDYSPYLAQAAEAGEYGTCDVAIIGAGVVGCGIARELARSNLDILVVEASDDVCTGASKANNGHIHPGHAAAPGTLKAKLNVRGNYLYTRWAEELGFEFQRCGSMAIITDERERPGLEKLLAVGIANGVPGIELVSGERAREIEPGIEREGIEAVAALYMPSMGVVEPYQVVVALAENAAENGVRFLFNATVADVLRENGEVKGVVTSKGTIRARYVINCAGVYSDEISAMAGDRSHTIHPRRGTLVIMDKNVRPLYSVNGSVYGNGYKKSKNLESKGGGMCRTPEWNILLGPSAVENPDKENVDSTPEEMEYVMALNQNANAGGHSIIKIFAGARPADFKEDFWIEMSPVTHGFVNVGAIQSPGLASAPAIAEMVVGIVADDYAARGERLPLREGFIPIRRRRPEFRHLLREEQDKLIRDNPAYGRVICRCETITEGEILDAIRSPVRPGSVDAVKRRTRAGMGRCQGGFCQPRVLELLSRELGLDPAEVTLKGQGTNILLTDNRVREVLP